MEEQKLNTIIDLFERSCRLFPEHPYLWEKREGKYLPATYTAVHEQVLQVAGGLMAAGLERGERVALLGEGCNEWVYGELGILYAGGVNVPLSMKLTPSEVVFRVNHSEARFLMVSDYYLQVVRQVEGELKTVEKVFVLRRDGSLDGKYISFGELQEAGKQVHPEEVMLRAREVGADDLANISYTSGTTAEPKGIMLTHGNYVSNVLQADSLIQIPPYYKVLLFLPWNMEGTELVGKLAAFKGFQWIPEYTGKYFHVFSVTVSERPVTAFRTEDMVMEDHFEQLWEISVDHPVMRNLQKRGVAFARQALRFPVGWQPNDGHGYDRGDLKNLVLKTVPNGSVGHSISFSGWGGGAIMTQRQFRADRGYWLLLGFRGTGASRIGVYLYCYDENGRFLKTEAVRYFCGTSIDFEQNEALLIEQFPAGTAKFTLALELVDGHLLLDRVFLREY